MILPDFRSEAMIFNKSDEEEEEEKEEEEGGSWGLGSTEKI